MSEIRFCHKCETSMPASEFYPSVKSRCRICCKKEAEKSRESRIKYMSDWRKRNPNAASDWYKKNKDRKVCYNKKFYADNRDSERSRYDSWASENKAKVNALTAKRNAAKRSATPPWAKKDEIIKFYEEADRMTKNTGIKHEVDHIIPIQGDTVCGLHWEGNLQVLTKADNIRKKNKLLQEYIN